MPNEKAAEPLSEEKLAELEARVAAAKATGWGNAWEWAESLLAEVRLGREALKALEDLYFVAATRLPGEVSDAETAAFNVLRKAGRR